MRFAPSSTPQLLPAANSYETKPDPRVSNNRESGTRSKRDSENERRAPVGAIE